MSTFALSVCSAILNKCYILVEDIQSRYGEDVTSWSFVDDSICKSNNWTMLSLHSEREQDFIGYTLLHRLSKTNNAYVYIGT